MPKYGLITHWKKEKAWSASYPNKTVTGAVLSPKGLRVPFARRIKIREYKAALNSATSAVEKGKAYQRYYGALVSAGQIEKRFAIGARAVLNEWRSNEDAWAIHTLTSVNRSRQ